MVKFVAPLHGILTLALMAMYLFLAIRFFQNKDNKASTFDRFLAHIARYSLLIIYFTGLVMNITLGAMVHKLHHLLAIFPAVLMVGIRYWPVLTRRENTTKTFAWFFAILFFLMLLISFASKLHVMPQF